MIEDSTSEYAILLIFRFWIYVTTILVHSGCSEHLLKALPRVCSGQQVDSSCVIQSHLLTTSADEPSIEKELVELIDIISKFPTTNHPQNSDSSPTAKGVADGFSIDESDDSEDDGEDESDYDSDLENAFTISPPSISACASLSQYHSGNPVHNPQECTLDSQSCPVVSPSVLALVGPQQSSWNRQENIDSVPHSQIGGSTRDASLSPKPSQINTQEQSATCPEESISEAGESAIPPDILPIIQRIAGPEIISKLWYYLRDQRSSPTGTYVHGELETLELGDTAEVRIERLLSRYQLEFATLSSNCSHFPELPRRLYLAKIHTLYMQETEIRRQLPRPRKKRKVDKGIKTAKRSVKDIFVDFLLPYLPKGKSTRQSAKKGKSTRQSAKRGFENWMALGRICANLIESFGASIFLLIPRDLSNEILRVLTKRQEDAIVTYINHTYPGLKSDIQHLTSFLLHVVEEQRPPNIRLKLELLSEDDMMSYKRVSRPMQDLFDYSDEVDYTSFLTDEALSSSATEPPHLFA